MYNPVAIVTGAGSGIGRAAALMLARRGFALVLVGRRRSTLEETAALAPAGATLIPADVGAEAGADSVVRGALGAFGRIDAIVNNAAAAPFKPLAEFAWPEMEAVFRANTVGPAAIIARAWPALVAQHRAAGTIARIVNVSSMSAIDPFPGLTVYGASKAALHALTRGCANEGEAEGIYAFAVAPGAVETAMLRAIVGEEALPRSATLSPERVAEVIVACAAGERDEENGGVIVVPSG